MSFHRQASCSASVWPWTVISSAIPMQPSHSSSMWSILFWKTFWEQARPKGRHKKQYWPYGVLKVVSKLDLDSRTTAQYPCLASNIVKYLEWANSWPTSSTVGVQKWSLWMALLRSRGSKQMCNSLDAFQAYATDETQSVGSSTWVMTSGFTILSNSTLTLGCMEIGHFWGACMTHWALSCSLILYLPGNWPMPSNLSGNFLMRSSVDLIGTVFLGVAGAGLGPGRWEVSWITLTAQFILTASNLSHYVSPRMAGPGVYATYQQEFIWWGCALEEPGCQMMGPWSDPNRDSGVIVGSEPSIAHIDASWVTCLLMQSG